MTVFFCPYRKFQWSEGDRRVKKQVLSEARSAEFSWFTGGRPSGAPGDFLRGALLGNFLGEQKVPGCGAEPRHPTLCLALRWVTRGEGGVPHDKCLI